MVIVDCRSVLDFNACHITGAVNLACSKVTRKRLHQNTVPVYSYICWCLYSTAVNRHSLIILTVMLLVAKTKDWTFKAKARTKDCKFVFKDNQGLTRV